MRQINFLVIFALCLALVLFGMQNTEPVTIQLIEGVDVEAPLAIELVVTMGVGAVLAWVFSLWARLQSQLGSMGDRRRIRKQTNRIEELEEEIEKFQQQLEANQPQLMPADEKAGTKEAAQN